MSRGGFGHGHDRHIVLKCIKAISLMLHCATVILCLLGPVGQSNLWCASIMSLFPLADITHTQCFKVQSFCPNFWQLATGLVAKFLKTKQLATELVATSCNWLLTYIG